jgi:uncharacterized membrane protein YbjE (DUF340 family)
MQQYPAGDPIAQLPVDQSQPTSNELQIVNTLFTTHKNIMDTIVEEAKDSLLIGFLFIVFSLPVIDNLIKRVLPMSEKSSYILIAIKALAVMALYWLIKHFYLSRKTS